MQDHHTNTAPTLERWHELPADFSPLAASEIERHALRAFRRLSDEGKTALLRGLRALTTEERTHV